MQIEISHNIEDSLRLPIGYHHILQAIIYAGMNKNQDGLGDYFHEHGFTRFKRRYKLFTFGLLQGKYCIEGKNIIFSDRVSFQVRSSDHLLLQVLGDNIRDNGIHYGKQYFENVQIKRMDRTVEDEEILIRMLSPICVYRTDSKTGKTYYYEPWSDDFEDLINMNFRRKYEACFGVEPRQGIGFMPVQVGERDKYVTRYKNFYITAWWGEYMLVGERKYLDFLYQTGLGAKNSQGFGMFEIVKE